MTGGTGPKSWTYAALGELTFAQLRNELYAGKTAPDRRGRRMSKAAVKQFLADFKSGKW